MYAGTKGNWFADSSTKYSTIPETTEAYWAYTGCDDEEDVQIDMFINKPEDDKIRLLVTKILSTVVADIVVKYPAMKEYITIRKNRFSNHGEFGFTFKDDYEECDKMLNTVVAKLCPKQYKPLKLQDGAGNFKLAFVDSRNKISRIHIDMDHETREMILVYNTLSYVNPRERDKALAVADRVNARKERLSWIGTASMSSIIGGMAVGSVGLMGVTPALVVGSIMVILGYTGLSIQDYLVKESTEFNTTEHFNQIKLN